MLPVVYGFEVTKRQIIIWIACLIPLPFFLGGFGWPIVHLGTVLNIGWLAFAALWALQSKDIMKWSTLMFVYSLNYLTIFFVAMIIITLFKIR